MSQLPEISVNKLTFSHAPANPQVEPSLIDISLALQKGSRTILVGANGGKSNLWLQCSLRELMCCTAGKSTLLQILAGKRLISSAEVKIKDKDVFRQYPGGVAFLGTEWSALSVNALL